MCPAAAKYPWFAPELILATQDGIANMKLLVIYNPQAGGGRAAKLLAPIKQYLNSHSAEVRILLTERSGHAVELASQTDFTEYQGIIASGGDGTLFEVLNGYMNNPSRQKPPLGLIPNGTGNAFMKELGLQEKDWQQAIDIIIAQQSKLLDIGRFQCEGSQHYFINMVGLGFVSQVAQAAIPLKWLGNGAYTAATLQKLVALKAQPLKLTLDGKSFERQGVFVEVANSRFTGTRFLMAPRAKLDDGLLDVVLLNSISRLKLLRLFTSIYDGSHINYPEIEYLQAEKIEVIESRPNRLIPDGEVLGQSPVSFQCLAKAVSFFWPT